MPPQLLPASAAAFAPRASSVNVVLSSKVEPWLTQTLKRINRIKRPLNSVPQHQRCLTETLSSATAIWTLGSLMLSKAPEQRREDENPLVEALFNYQLIHIEAYVVHVDMVLRNEVAYKLTPDTIESLIEFHKEVHCLDIAANTYNWSEKDQQVKKMHEDFIQAINKFVYRTHVSALEGLEEDGAGELLCGKSDEVKNNIMGLFLPLLPPPPRIVDVVRPPTLLPSSPAGMNWWSQPTISVATAAPVDPWRMIPSSPSTSSSMSSSTDTQSLWASMGLNEIQLPSPTPSYSQPFTTAGLYYSAPQHNNTVVSGWDMVGSVDLEADGIDIKSTPQRCDNQGLDLQIIPLLPAPGFRAGDNTSHHTMAQSLCTDNKHYIHTCMASANFFSGI
ncbi:hypothetical protein EYC84_007703 [Monilinia fructicola]|uniref:Uncharacterized protein n=1 Tax=Monilinia fructicola TaxID=38448 RepID=A0A5M9JLL5_MONFR|nr:hypothetical protein EYC84_007703 [Monilinia fructicola]